MKRVLSHLNNRLTLFLAVGLAVVLFAACKKDNDDVAEIPAAGLMAFNLAPDQQSVVVSLSGSILTQVPLSFTNYTGIYRNIYVGNRMVEAFDYPENSPLASTEFEFEDDKLYSVFVVGANDNYRSVVTLDDVDSSQISSGNAYIRYVNAVPDSSNPTVMIMSGGSELLNEQAAFASVSAFMPVTAGTIAVSINNGNGINASRDITVEAGRVYTILLAGLPDASDENQEVQIRYVQNGVLTENEGGI